MRILILGASGMLGNTLLRYFAPNHEVASTFRDYEKTQDIFMKIKTKIYDGVDIYDELTLDEVMKDFKPEVIMNCVGIIKQLDLSKQYYESIYVNALLPHKLVRLAEEHNAKLIHFSTDCVFTGEKGMYLESDPSDCTDLYGKSKFLGEVGYSSNALTFRTSIIGHELTTCRSLVDWFLNEEDSVNGYDKAIFSGLPTIEIAEIIDKHVLPKLNDYYGLYHLSVEPINKYDLLTMVAKVYNKKIKIVRDSELVIDRSLNSERFRSDFNYIVPSWETLIDKMRKDYIRFFEGKHKL